MIILLGWLKLLRSSIFVGVASVACLLLASFAPALGEFLNRLPLNNIILIGDRIAIFRLAGMFLAGTLFYLHQDRIPIRKSYLFLAIPCLYVALSSPKFANVGFAIFGSYILLATASLGQGTILAKINNRNDISYGVYLYAWPIEKVLIWMGLSGSLLVLGLSTFVLAAIAGAVSWFLIEKPAMKLGRPSVGTGWSLLNFRKRLVPIATKSPPGSCGEQEGSRHQL